MKETIPEVFVGIDVAKTRNAVAVAEGSRGGEVRYLGEVVASLDNMRKVVTKLATKYKKIHFCYEAGSTGYGLYRLITDLGHSCSVVAPSLIPRKPGDRVKTNRRDAEGLAKLLRAGECRSSGEGAQRTSGESYRRVLASVVVGSSRSVLAGFAWR